MSTRNDILEGLKSCLENITTTNGFNFSVKGVVRKFVFFDEIAYFPYILVLGGDETLEDNLGGYTVSKLSVRIMGYAKNSLDPEKEQCKLIEDVLACLNNDTYNTKKSNMRPIGIETDEGQLHAVGEGLSIFVLNLELTYRFERSNP